MEAAPPSTASVVVPTLASLQEAEQRVLSYASAMGKEFRFDLLALVCEMEEEPLAETLEDLVHHGILREQEGGDVYEFVRAEVLGHAYHSISSSRMRLIHKKIAEAFAKRYAENPPTELIPEIGRHFHLGKVYDRSVMYNRYSATLAREAFSPQTALIYLERVAEDLKAMPGDHAVERAEVMKEIGDLQFETGDAVRAEETYQRALEGLPEKEKAMRAYLFMGRADAYVEVYRLRAARECCDEALRLLQTAGNRRGLAIAHRLSSGIYFLEDDSVRARAETEAALALLDPATDQKEIARCYVNLANAYSNINDPQAQRAAVEVYHKAISELEKLNDFRELFRAHNNLAVAVGYAYPEEAVRQLARARVAAEKIRNPRNIGWALFNSAEFLVMLGKLDEAEQANSEAERILSRLDDPLAMQQIWMNKGILSQQRRKFEEAETAFRSALTLAEGFQRPSLMAEVHLRLAWLYEEWGRPASRVREMWEVRSLGDSQIAPQLRPMYERLMARMGQQPL